MIRPFINRAAAKAVSLEERVFTRVSLSKCSSMGKS